MFHCQKCHFLSVKKIQKSHFKSLYLWFWIWKFLFFYRQKYQKQIRFILDFWYTGNERFFFFFLRKCEKHLTIRSWHTVFLYIPEDVWGWIVFQVLLSYTLLFYKLPMHALYQVFDLACLSCTRYFFYSYRPLILWHISIRNILS